MREYEYMGLTFQFEDGRAPEGAVELAKRKPRRRIHADLMEEAEEELTNAELAEAVGKAKESPAKPNKAARKKSNK